MRHFFCTIVMLFAVAAAAQAQEVPQQLRNPGDTISFQRAPLADSTLVGKTVFHLLEGKEVTLNQPQEMDQAYARYIQANGERKMNGYRIRLFFSNKQSARTESEELEKEFQLQFPQIPTYRSYTNPFFKVVVGDYRTKSDAIRELNKILPFYPKAIVVKENIWFPAI